MVPKTSTYENLKWMGSKLAQNEFSKYAIFSYWVTF